MKRWWMVRAGDENELIPIWRNKGIASIGWPELGDPTKFNSKEELLVEANTIYDESKPNSRKSWVNQVWRFSQDIKKGDRIITYFKETREYLVGTVVEEYFYSEEIGNPYYPNNIKVEWEDNFVERDKLSQSAKNSLGSTLTIFRADEWGNEIEKLLADPYIELEPEKEEEESEIVKDLVSRAFVMVQDKIDELDPWEMQDLVGGLLQAMDYNVRVSPKGPDGGVDVLAYKDALGFEKPIIKVQVKHRKSSASAPEVRELLGANPLTANNLLVSTGGFTSNAIAEAQQKSVKLIDLEELVNLVIKFYEKMPNEIKSLILLKKFYIPE